jgi:hypothetical protein
MTDAEDFDLSPEDMRGWLTQEIRDVMKGSQLRIAEATEFVTAYCLGKISGKEAEERLGEYSKRWGDSPLPGIAPTEDMTDRAILKALNRNRSRWAGDLDKTRLSKNKDKRSR